MNILTIKRLLILDKKDITFKRIVDAIKRRITDIPQYISWKLPFGFSAQNREKIHIYKNKHAGQRCFILANGPSLKDMDFNLLKNEYTIGMNRIYLMQNVNGFSPTYLACVDKKSQLLQFTKEFDDVSIPTFYNWDLRNIFKNRNKHMYLKEAYNPRFSGNLDVEPFGSGSSVAYVCIQLAYYMGFSEVYLIGKDHSYQINEKAGKSIKSDGKEENHFIKNYYRPGMTWDAPDYISEEFSYSLAREVFEKNGRIIKDATINGKLNVFEKENFYSLFNQI
jgi:hypothetical protein